MYFDIYDKNFSNKNKHNKTKEHNQLSSSVVNRFHIKNVSVKETDNVLIDYITDYIKKIPNFVCWCEI